MNINLLGLYEYALDYCLERGAQKDINWLRSIPPVKDLKPNDFLAEVVWCIYNAGMKEKVIRDKWGDLRSYFWNFDIYDIIATEEDTFLNVLQVFNHKGKARAAIEAAKKIKQDSPINEKLAGLTEVEALAYLQTYPFIGKVTKYHVARNIGFDVVKPDRHLVRLTEFMGYGSPDAMVTEIAEKNSEKKGIIDFVFWRWLSWEGPGVYTVAEQYK